MNEAPQVPAGVDDIPTADSAAQVWECFLDGARNGEFDDAATSP
jgi:hypothetical protein